MATDAATTEHRVTELDAQFSDFNIKLLKQLHVRYGV